MAAPGAAGAGGDVSQDGGQVHGLGLLGTLAAGEGQVAADHAVHLGHVGGHVGDILVDVRRQEGQSEAETGERGAEVVGDAGQHLGALRQEAGDAGLHAVERGGGLADFGGAFRLDGPAVAADAERPPPRRPGGAGRGPGCA